MRVWSKHCHSSSGQKGNDMHLITLLAVCVAAVAATPRIFKPSVRIVGGTVTTIERWPYQANVMIGEGHYFGQWCGGTIINNRSVLTAAHCVLVPYDYLPAFMFRLRLGSTYASRGGVVHNVAQNILHPNYNIYTLDTDVMIMRSSTTFIYSNVLQRGTIASANYNLLDNQVVWVTGWGTQVYGGYSGSEELREVQVYTINQNVCSQRYEGGITANMLCTGVLDVGGRDACQGDSGGPVFHNRVVVGITSFGAYCGHPNYPGVNARVSRFTSWIVANA